MERLFLRRWKSIDGQLWYQVQCNNTECEYATEPQGSPKLAIQLWQVTAKMSR